MVGMICEEAEKILDGWMKMSPSLGREVHGNLESDASGQMEKRP